MLLDHVPKEKDPYHYFKVTRAMMLERWYIFSEFINGGGAGGEYRLLSMLKECALVRLKECALVRHKDDKQMKKLQWEFILSAEDVCAFLQHVDSMFSDRMRAAKEEQWRLAKSTSKTPLDMCLSMHPLMDTTEDRNRGFNMLVERICDWCISKGLPFAGGQQCIMDLMACLHHKDDLLSWLNELKCFEGTELLIYNNKIAQLAPHGETSPSPLPAASLPPLEPLPSISSVATTVGSDVAAAVANAVAPLLGDINISPLLDARDIPDRFISVQVEVQGETKLKRYVDLRTGSWGFPDQSC